MKAVGAETMRAIDEYAIDEYGIPGIVLMENAALGILEEMQAYRDKRILVLCGKGNNGGDGYALARHLYHRGYDVMVACEGATSADAMVNYEAAWNCGVPFTGFEIDFKEYDILVDALLGTGISGEVTGQIKEVIDRINSAGKRVISIDIPSGMDALRGDYLGQSVRADQTITLALPKPGLYCSPNQTGEIIVKDISIPDELIRRFDIIYETTEENQVRAWLPERKADSHKGDFGKGLIIAASKGMTGAGVLSAKAASASGMGLVCEAVPESVHDIMEIKLTEEMTLPLADVGTGEISETAISQIEQKLPWADSVLFGCGLGRGSGAVKVLEQLLGSCRVPLVIDADGLYALSQNPDMLLSAACPVILTPHAAEMARLCGKSAEEIQSDRFGAVKEFSEKYHCVTLLKGANTLVSDGNRTYINTTGNNGMATGGSGDVLSGVLLALAAQGTEPVKAAAAAAYLHGTAGDLAADKFGVYGVTAGKILDSLPLAFQAIHLK